MKKWLKLFAKMLILILIFLIIWLYFSLKIKPPKVENRFDANIKKEKIAADTYTYEDSWLKKNQYGLWEMYISGSPFEMGYKNGILTDSINKYQEQAFVDFLQELVPSKFYINFLKYIIIFFNRNLDNHIPLDLQKEIYGVSLFASKEFNFIGSPYQRMLNYHAAHDIGHALQNMNLVACTAFEVKGDKSVDSSMLIGRNMDFSSGDKFAENKIIAFCKPDRGYNFCYITWPGMIGVVSGMNNQGLVVTLNAAKSDIPTSAKTPVSILARYVLQNASNIDEAYNIIKKFKTFVSECFLISSGRDNKTVVIEKSINKVGIYQTDSNSLILTNHFQSKELNNNKSDKENLSDETSVYRWKRVQELLNNKEKHDIYSFASILRNQKGLNNSDIGMGNEKAINQLIAHHSIIFKPQKLQIWISTNPFQLGKYLCYDLNNIFNDTIDISEDLFIPSLCIGEDTFLYSNEFKNFNKYKETTKNVKKMFSNSLVFKIPRNQIEEYEKLNPNYYYTYYIIGEYYRLINDKQNALKYYNIALTKGIPKTTEKTQIEKQISKIKNEN